MEKFVYLFTEGSGEMKNLLGGKGANLAEMTNLGMPVPQGFTVSTEACTKYYEGGGQISPAIKEEISNALKKMEELCGKKFGDEANPLLVSVRSGARASMPGMMDTILNLGLNDTVVLGLSALTGNERFAFDSYRRFIQMFSDVVMEVPKSSFEKLITKMKREKGVKLDTELTADDLKELTSQFKAHFEKEKGFPFPQQPNEQLFLAIEAVFRSWNNERAIIYRRMNDIPGSWGTAVNVQSMVFGNMGDTSGTGVAFTRNPSTGEKKLYGEFLMNAQGEDVVAGVRTPEHIDKLKDVMPEIYDEFASIANRLENHYRDMQDMEFTIENGKLYMLQTRNGKRTAAAALKIAIDLVEEKMISKEEAILKVDPKQLESLLHPQFDATAIKNAKCVASGLPASPGAACGQVYFEADDAVTAAKAGQAVLLVRLETSPEDIGGMAVAQGILTARGGMTSHAAVVARSMGTCCVAGCDELNIDEHAKIVKIGDNVVNEGDFLSIDGTTGKIYLGQIKTVDATIADTFDTFMAWSDEFRTLKVRANADTPHDAITAYKFGAEGIGLCRTEHMFFEESRIEIMREMILSKTVEQRTTALDKLLPMQISDFTGLFKEMRGYPVTIRFLDPPLHEFLPTNEEQIAELAKNMNIPVEEIKFTITSLHEFNPMLGHRGCRLAISYPEIAKMQTKAVIKAAIDVIQNGGSLVPEIMIPLVGDSLEFKYIKDLVVAEATRVMEKNGVTIEYKVGTMMEIPRACLTADEIAKDAEFFSFGTNDLTQMTFGFSRDDATKFLDDYYAKKIFESDPFSRLDIVGVGSLIKIAAEKGRSARPGIKLGICGEHGGDPSSVEFCHTIGLDYVSCSPFRVPIARLAAAQAAIKSK